MDHDLFEMFQSIDDTPVERENYVRAPFPYVGAKNRSLQNMLQYLPYSDTWIDGFGGSGSVTLARKKSKFEVFNDTHAGIVAFYRCLQNKEKRDKLIERIELTVHSREEFIWCKETWDHDVHDDIERAARWYYMITYSFGAVGRNFGRSISSKCVFSGKIQEKLKYFNQIHERFDKVQIENLDWRLILKDYDSHDTVFYLDPPYYGMDIYKDNMTKPAHIELCERIFQCEGFVALSGYSNPIYDNFPWDNIYSWEAPVTVSTRAIETDTSNVKRIGIDTAIEYLWIKDFK